MLYNVSTISRWPQMISREDLVELAKKKLGKRFLSVRTYNYSGQKQTEVRSLIITYDGQRCFKRDACYKDQV